MGEQGTLKWRFDVSTFRLIGRDLITDRVTALFELVKNCYDANATDVTVKFDNVGVDKQGSSIRIEDNGIGMSFEDIRDKWMVIGTPNKRRNPYTPAPFSRKCVGEKGIGRFAVDKLGNKVNIITKQENSSDWLNVEIDWDAYYNQDDSNGGIKLFTDIENRYSYQHAVDSKSHGTTLLITNVHEVWSAGDINRFKTEVAKIVSPFVNVTLPFKIKVVAEEYGINSVASKDLNDINIATIDFTLNYNELSGRQDIAEFNRETGKIDIKSTPLKSFGGIKMRVYYFDDQARKRYRKEFPNNEIDGIKIYRDNIITTPFAENEQKNDKKRDILGIDKRLWENVFDRVSTREIIGIVEISKDENPSIIDATNRQDFVDNEQYRDLKEFIIHQLGAIEDYKKYIRDSKKKTSRKELDDAGKTFSELITTVENVSNENPSLKESLIPVIETAKKTDRVVQTAIKVTKKAEEEFTRKESVYMSIMSLQEYAIHITHAVRTTLNKIRDKVEYFKLFFPNSDPEEEEIFKEYTQDMSKEFRILNKVIDYMLSYSQSTIKPEDIDICETIREIFHEYGIQLKNYGIKSDLILPEKFMLKNTNRQFFRDILQNLLDNSIKAVRNSDPKIIKCSIIEEDRDLVLLFSDTGIGIPEDLRKWVFGLYNTTTQDQGGAGVGLYIVRTRVESLKGKVEIVNSEFGSIGTTVRIKLPFKK